MRGTTPARAIVARASLIVLFALAPNGMADSPPNYQTLAAECRANGGNERLCRSLEQLGRTGAQLCRYPGLPDQACGELDGRSISESRVDDYETGWVHRALALQSRLDEKSPLVLGLIPGTHNSFNSAHYYPTLSGLDHNQVYSLRDQLRMDMRGLELDVHWMPSPYGEPQDGGFAPILCHGQDETVSEGTHVHPGCTAERHLREGLEELRGWLDAHPDQFLLLYLENHLDNQAGHDAAARTIEAELGPLVLRPPPGEPCSPMPVTLSRRDILDGKHQVLIVGNCGPGEWGSWVHERDLTNNWRESLDLPGDYPGCAALHGNGGADDYDTHFIRFYEDSTWLSAMVSGTENPITTADTLGLVHCGANLLGFDQLTPEDPRLAAMVWSWAESEPAEDPALRCAREEGGDGRLRAADCGNALSYACRKSDGGWAVTVQSGAWSGGFDACSTEFPGSSFAVSATGYDNELLRGALPASGSVWLNYALSGGQWTPGLPSGAVP